jgi:hypothetical protein
MKEEGKMRGRVFAIWAILTSAILVGSAMSPATDKDLNSARGMLGGNSCVGGGGGACMSLTSSTDCTPGSGICTGSPREILETRNNDSLTNSPPGNICLTNSGWCITFKNGTCQTSVCSSCTGNTIPPECNTCYSCYVSWGSPMTTGTVYKCVSCN